MRKARYTVYDTGTGAYLMLAEQLLPGVTVTTWTHSRERAQKFPGTKSARGMAARLGDCDKLAVMNGRGERV